MTLVENARCFHIKEWLPVNLSHKFISGLTNAVLKIKIYNEVKNEYCKVSSLLSSTSDDVFDIKRNRNEEFSFYIQK